MGINRCLAETVSDDLDVFGHVYRESGRGRWQSTKRAHWASARFEQIRMTSREVTCEGSEAVATSLTKTTRS